MAKCIHCGKRQTIVHRCKSPGSGRFDRDRQVREVTWFETTDHCGRCGQPGAYCLCTDANPCGCAHLHTMGSGLAPDALIGFIAEPVEAIEQEGLFG